jgi:hypothetical protein
MRFKKMSHQIESLTKVIIKILIALFSVNVYSNETSICSGQFETGQPIKVLIDWDNKTVNVNKFNTYIEGVTTYGIITGSYMNKLGINTFSIIGHFQNAGTFIAQQQVQYGQITTTNFARLSCNKSFYKPFTDRMLDN